MRYVKVSWEHDLKDEPIEIWAELDDTNNEIRKLERYRDGTYGFADDDLEFGGTLHALEPWPVFSEIGAKPEFSLAVISESDFNLEWQRAVSSRHSRE